VANVTPEISSSPKGMAGVAPIGTNAAAELAAVAASETPATLRAVKALFDFFTLEARLICDINRFLLQSPPNFQVKIFNTFPML
jgi:hypothetical protein